MNGDFGDACGVVQVRILDKVKVCLFVYPAAVHPRQNGAGSLTGRNRGSCKNVKIWGLVLLKVVSN